MYKSLIGFLLPFFLIQMLPPLLHPQSDGRRGINEIETRLEKASGRTRVNLLVEAGTLLRETDLDRAWRCCQEALKLSQRLGYERGQGEARIAIGFIQVDRQEYAAAIDSADCARALFEKNTDRRGRFLVSFLTGRIYFRRNWDHLAFEHLQRALDLGEPLPGIERELLLINTNLAMISCRIKNYREAERYARQGLSLAKRTGNDWYQGTLVMQLGNVRYEEKKFKEAIRLYQTAISHYADSGDLINQIQTRLNIANCYDGLNHPEQALAILIQMLEQDRNHISPIVLCKTLIMTGRFYTNSGRLSQAEAHFKEAAAILPSLDKWNEQVFYSEYAPFCFQAGRFREAYEFLEKNRDLEAEIRGIDHANRISELEARFQTERHAREKEGLERDNRIARLIRNLFILGFFLALFILALIIKKYLYLFAFWKKEKYIGQYRIMETIGSGGMGIVYKAHPLRDKNFSVAIKVMKDELLQSDAYQRRFKREGMIIDRLRHPHILKIHERGQDGSRLFLVMEHLQGTTLDRWIEKTGPVSLPVCLHIVGQVSDALCQIHAEKIIHRDLKPANVMLINQENDPCFVKLLDFGLSKIPYHSRLTATGTMMGTIHYLAPEQIAEKICISASDIYSLGVILHEMLTGTQLYGEETMAILVNRILEEPPPPPSSSIPGIPPPVDQLVLSMLAKEPDQRPTSLQALEWIRVLEKEFPIEK